VPEVCLVPDQRAVQQLTAQRLDPALHDRVHAGHPDTGQDRRDPGAAEDLVDQCGVLAVTIANGAMLETCGSAGEGRTFPVISSWSQARPTLARRSGRHAHAHRSPRALLR
jgi:hypothetical protein